jgi:hypothetical protein
LLGTTEIKDKTYMTILAMLDQVPLT